MATVPTNNLQQVQTYNDAKLGYLMNLNCFMTTLNTRYRTFNDQPANLGDTINLELQNRSTVNNGLVVSYQPVQQRLVPLICDQARNSANAFTSQQFIFSADEYMEKFGMARMQELNEEVEATLAKNADSSVPVMIVDSNGQSVPTGALHTESGPYLFYGDGVTPINSFGQLAKMEAYRRNYGSVNGPLKVYFDDIATVEVINSGLGQFALERNNEIANSWDLGTYKGSNARYYKSNLLPVHVSGTAGDNRDELTLVSTDDPTGQNITQLTFSGVSVNAFAFRSGDLLKFNPSTGLFYLTFIGHKPSQNPVQMRVLSDADATAGTVTISITPALSWVPGPNQNLSKPLVAGMKASAVPSHRCGLITSGDGFFLAAPPLDLQEPFPTAISTKDNISIRNYYGSQFGQNLKGYVTDIIFAGLAVPEYCTRICFPIGA